MRISLGFVADDWKQLTFASEEEWQTAVSIFSERVSERFLQPIARIDECDRAGFAVMALDCLLIEMLQQFREGVHRTPAGKSKLYFINFLTKSSFGDSFTEKMAEVFYRQIRCGILHQAEVRGNSRILVDEEIPLVDFADSRSGVVVNRKSFHERLLQEFERYKEELLDSENEVLRNRFRRKMAYICQHACEVI
jgi:hypothetical protein